MKNISVVIPAYNAEKTLRRCVDSVIDAAKQYDMEIIIINDGSTDSTALICDEYAGKYDFIKIIHESNGGPCKARNAGIDSASGDYLTFVDSDDSIVEGFYDKCLRLLSAMPADMLFYGLAYVSGEKMTPVYKEKIPAGQLLDRKFINEKLVPPLINLTGNQEYFIENYAVNKLYKRDILVNHRIRFDEGRHTWEDRPFLVEYSKYMESFLYLPDIGYHYISTPNSLSKCFSDEYLSIILSNFRYNERLFGDEYDVYSPYATSYYCHSFINNSLRLMEYPEHESTAKQMIQDFLADELAQTLFSRFHPENNFEEQVSQNLLVRDADSLWETIKNEYENQQKEKQKRRKLSTRVLGRIKSIVKGK